VEYGWKKSETKKLIFRNAFEKIYKISLFLKLYVSCSYCDEKCWKNETSKPLKDAFLFAQKKSFYTIMFNKAFHDPRCGAGMELLHFFVNHMLLHNMLDKEDNWINLPCHVSAHRIQTCANLDKGAGHNCTIFTIYGEQNKGFPYIMCISLRLSRFKQQ
jgi:hypothetical protein